MHWNIYLNFMAKKEVKNPERSYLKFFVLLGSVDASVSCSFLLDPLSSFSTGSQSDRNKEST